MELQLITDLLNWLRQYFAACAIVYLGAAAMGAWWATREGSRPLWILWALLGLVYGVALPYHWSFTNDDSFIFFRYAENVAAGHGLTYNHGVPCEGFTSPAWMYFLASSVKLGFPALIASKVLGALFGAVAIGLILLTVRRITTDSRILFLVGFFVTTSQLLLAWIPSGMDTAVFVAWTAWWVYLLSAESPSLGMLLVATAVGVWVRPEANLLAVAGWGWIIHRDRASLRRTLLLATGLATLLLLLPFVWRLAMFGDFLPTTYYAKSDRTLRSGMGFLFGAIQVYGPVIWAVALVGLWQLRRRMGWAGLTTGLLAGYVVWAGGDVLIQRFSLWWLALLSLGMAAGLTLLATKRVLEPRAIVFALALLLAGQELHRMHTITRAKSENDGYVYVSANSIHTTEADAAVGRYLHEHGQPTDTVETDNIGAIGYYSGMTVIDACGLIDPAVAKLIHENRQNEIAQLIVRQSPRWIVCYPAPPESQETYSLINVGDLPPEIADRYDAVQTWRSRTGYTRILLRRRDG